MKKFILMAVMIVALGSCTTDEILNETAVQVCRKFQHSNYDSLILNATTDEEKAELEAQLASSLRACENI